MQELWRVRTTCSPDVSFQVRSIRQVLSQRGGNLDIQWRSPVHSPSWSHCLLSALLLVGGDVECLFSSHRAASLIYSGTSTWERPSMLWIGYEHTHGVGGRSCSPAVLLDHGKTWGRMAKTFLGCWWESWAEISEAVSITSRCTGSKASVCGDVHCCSVSVGGEFSLFWWSLFLKCGISQGAGNQLLVAAALYREIFFPGLQRLTPYPYPACSCKLLTHYNNHRNFLVCISRSLNGARAS